MRKLAKLGLAVLAIGTVLWLLSGLADSLKGGNGTVGGFIEARNAAISGR